jgi:hypothetical protein
VNANTFSYRIPTGDDEWFYGMSADDRRSLRWAYRHARLCGTDRRVARLVIHQAFHIGVRTEMAR